MRCPPPGLGSPRFCSSEHVARVPLRSVWHLIPRELGQRGGRLLRRPRISGVYFICPPHCFLVPCWQRACSTGPFSPRPCSPVHCIPGSAVAALRLASLLPAPLGTTPPFTPPARPCDACSRDDQAAGNLDASRWNLQGNRSYCAFGTRYRSYHDGRGISFKHTHKVCAKLATAYDRGRNAKDSDGHREQYRKLY